MSTENSLFDFNIEDVMTELSDHRDIFTSEADFQFALAWEIKQLYPEYTIRLEETLDIGDDEHHFIHVDITIHNEDDKIIPIELKYCTKSAPVADLDGFILKIKVQRTSEDTISSRTSKESNPSGINTKAMGDSSAVIAYS